jgi:hypothetical protein
MLRSGPLHQRVGLKFVDASGVLLDEFADHFEMAELLEGNVLHHVMVPRLSQ